MSTRRRTVWLAAAGVIALAVVAIVASHLWPRSITSNDIGVAAAAFTALAAIAALLAAQESSRTADEARSAYRLHFRPSSAQFSLRAFDPKALDSSIFSEPDPPFPVWALINTDYGGLLDLTISWGRDRGSDESARLDSGQDSVQLTGISSPGFDPSSVSKVPLVQIRKLVLRGRDPQSATKWIAQLPEMSSVAAIGDVMLQFEIDE